jgi:hypothetical protein
MQLIVKLFLAKSSSCGILILFNIVSVYEPCATYNSDACAVAV